MLKLLGKPKILLTFFTVVYFTILLITMVQLFDKSYVLKNSDIFKLDTIKILSRAYYLTSSKSTSKSGLEFEDSTLKTFRVESANLDNDEELKMLFDTLQFSKTTVTVYTDKEGRDNYRNRNYNGAISALNILIGDKTFGNINTVNANLRRKLTFLLTASTIAYGLFLLIYFNRTRT